MPLIRNIILTLIFTCFSIAQVLPEDIVFAKPILGQNGIKTNTSMNVALEIDILSPWHVYSPKVNDEFSIPIQVIFEDSSVSISDWHYPEADFVSVAGIKEPSAVFGGKFYLTATLTVGDVSSETLDLKGSVYYQACNDESCLIPTEVPWSVSIPVLSADKAITMMNESLFELTETMDANEPIDANEQASDEVSDLIAEKGLVLSLIFIFFGGLALNLTPCVYPLIPITISFFGGKDQGRMKTFWMALAYVFGIAITYSVLGVFAAMTGSLFGTLLTHPAVLIGIAVIMVGLSLSMFGVYEFRLPSGLMMAAGQTKTGILGSLFMGLTLGIVAAPCVGPFVIGLLTYVAKLQDPFMGFLLFFTLAIGLGIPYLFIAMFSSRFSSMPRSGAWMIGVRVIFGIILIGMAIYFVMPLMGDFGMYVVSIFLILSGAYLIILNKDGNEMAGFRIFKQVLAIVSIMAGSFLAAPEHDANDASIKWEKPYTMEEVDALLATNQTIMMDFYADWCIPCKEMDKLTFPDEKVVELSQSFVMIKIDLTKASGEFETAVYSRFGIQGVPTYLFLKPEINEIRALRSSGFENAETFVKRMKAALK